MGAATDTNNEVDSFVASQVDVAEDYPVATSKAKEKQIRSGNRQHGTVELPAVGKTNNRNRQAAATTSPPPVIKVNDSLAAPNQVIVKPKLNKFVKERSPPPPPSLPKQEQSKAASGTSLI